MEIGVGHAMEITNLAVYPTNCLQLSLDIKATFLIQKPRFPANLDYALRKAGEVDSEDPKDPQLGATYNGKPPGDDAVDRMGPASGNPVEWELWSPRGSNTVDSDESIPQPDVEHDHLLRDLEDYLHLRNAPDSRRARGKSGPQDATRALPPQLAVGPRLPFASFLSERARKANDGFPNPSFAGGASENFTQEIGSFGDAYHDFEEPAGLARRDSEVEDHRPWNENSGGLLRDRGENVYGGQAFTGEPVAAPGPEKPATGWASIPCAPVFGAAVMDSRRPETAAMVTGVGADDHVLISRQARAVRFAEGHLGWPVETEYAMSCGAGDQFTSGLDEAFCPTRYATAGSWDNANPAGSVGANSKLTQTPTELLKLSLASPTSSTSAPNQLVLVGSIALAGLAVVSALGPRQDCPAAEAAETRLAFRQVDFGRRGGTYDRKSRFGSEKGDNGGALRVTSGLAKPRPRSHYGSITKPASHLRTVAPPDTPETGKLSPLYPRPAARKSTANLRK
ncbi:MAG: hypothetical protein BJ554DRAFT_5614 [Olpidium bornovanus]|uniref:Uncharacterized protein n=1 Tax=Olpidium bornovanus TaxID=278681 RepID=A0A8H7ZZ92_9FUNG|nr:MAG: hypothetical protein BJ554DRAFT_5614 [Olpidium bornovanus]